MSSPIGSLPSFTIAMNSCVRYGARASIWASSSPSNITSPIRPSLISSFWVMISSASASSRSRR